jgi:hypothetical protein
MSCVASALFSVISCRIVLIPIAVPVIVITGVKAAVVSSRVITKSRVVAKSRFKLLIKTADELDHLGCFSAFISIHWRDSPLHTTF